jgi:hypothetical protein
VPNFLTPDAARFELTDGQPVLVLLADPPAEAGEWSLFSRATMLVADGPGDEGFVLPRLGADVPAGWDEAVTVAGGAEIRFGAQPSAPRVFARNLG